MLEPFAPGAGPGCHVQQRQAADIGRRNDLSLRQEFRRCDRSDRLAHQKRAVRVRPVGHAVVDRRVEPLAGEVEAPDARGEIDGDIGMAGDEIGDQRHQPARAEGRQDCKIENAAMSIAHQSERGIAQLAKC